MREDLNQRAAARAGRAAAAQVVIENYPEGQVEELDAVNNPEDPAAGTRKVPFCRELYIEQDDFREDPPPKYFRLSPGREVRLRYALLHHVHERGQGRDRRGRRAALHLRPGDARRRRARRPQGEGHDPLGLGRARRRRPRCGCTTPVHQGPSPTMSGEDWQVEPESQLAGGAARGCKLEPSAGRGRARVALPVRAPGLLLRRISRLRAGPGGVSCSTARSPPATAGPRSSEGAASSPSPRRRQRRACTSVSPRRGLD